MQIKYFNNDKAEKHFVAEDIALNQKSGTFVSRIKDKKQYTNSRLDLEERLDDKCGKFIKPSKISRLGHGTANPDKENMSVVTFNIPQENNAYKAIFYNSWTHDNKEPLKIFSSIEEGKWLAIPTPSQTLIEKCKEERAKLYEHYFPSRDEKSLMSR